MACHENLFWDAQAAQAEWSFVVKLWPRESEEKREPGCLATGMPGIICRLVGAGFQGDVGWSEPNLSGQCRFSFGACAESETSQKFQIIGKPATICLGPTDPHNLSER